MQFIELTLSWSVGSSEKVVVNVEAIQYMSKAKPVDGYGQKNFYKTNLNIRDNTLVLTVKESIDEIIELINKKVEQRSAVVMSGDKAKTSMDEDF